MHEPATVTLRTPDGALHELGHGDVIGRMWSAALQIDDARISEAHALVSLRGHSLKLLALRGLFALQAGKPLKELELAAGQSIRLADDLVLDVVDVQLPGRVMVLRSERLGRQVLNGVCSLRMRPAPRLRPGARQNAPAVFFVGADGWKVHHDGRTEDLTDGWCAEIDGERIEAAWEALDGGALPTRVGGRVDAPLRVVTRYDSVMIEREGEPTLRLTGHAARLVSELAAIGAPLHWEPLARELWSEPLDAQPLRRRFDAVLGRFRRKLSEAGIRSDLVRSDHSGLFELVLHEADALVDENG